VTHDRVAVVRDPLGVGPTHLARGFKTTFGIAPHAYVVTRRLEVARDRILAGQPLADVASEVGFFDQAHLTRRFKRFLGVTPGRFPTGADPDDKTAPGRSRRVCARPPTTMTSSRRSDHARRGRPSLRRWISSDRRQARGRRAARDRRLVRS
jgi:AraC-like DNA-binding protein